MPTASQWQIIQKVTSKKDVVPSETQEEIADKLKSLDIKDDEEDVFGIKVLRTKLNDVKLKESQKKKVEEEEEMKEKDSVSETKRVINTLPKALKSNLLRLGFRNSMFNVKKNLGQLVDEAVVNERTETDDWIRQLRNNQKLVPMKDMKPPELRPKAVCFNFPNSDLSHRDVKKAMDGLLITFPEIRMTTIEFQPRCKLMRTDKKEISCRWVVSFNTEWGRSRMTNKDFMLNDVCVVLKRYDEVVRSEYKHARRMAEIMMIVKNA